MASHRCRHDDEDSEDYRDAVANTMKTNYDRLLAEHSFATSSSSDSEGVTGGKKKRGRREREDADALITALAGTRKAKKPKRPKKAVVADRLRGGASPMGMDSIPNPSFLFRVLIAPLERLLLRPPEEKDDSDKGTEEKPSLGRVAELSKTIHNVQKTKNSLAAAAAANGTVATEDYFTQTTTAGIAPRKLRTDAFLKMCKDQRRHEGYMYVDAADDYDAVTGGETSPEQMRTCQRVVVGLADTITDAVFGSEREGAVGVTEAASMPFSSLHLVSLSALFVVISGWCLSFWIPTLG